MVWDQLLLSLPGPLWPSLPCHLRAAWEKSVASGMASGMGGKLVGPLPNWVPKTPLPAVPKKGKWAQVQHGNVCCFEGNNQKHRKKNTPNKEPPTFLLFILPQEVYGCRQSMLSQRVLATDQSPEMVDLAWALLALESGWSPLSLLLTDPQLPGILFWWHQNPGASTDSVPAASYLPQGAHESPPHWAGKNTSLLTKPPKACCVRRPTRGSDHHSSFRYFNDGP